MDFTFIFKSLEYLVELENEEDDTKVYSAVSNFYSLFEQKTIKLSDSIELFIPGTVGEFFKIGRLMNNCVGTNEGYRQRAGEGYSIIVVVREKGKETMLAEIKHDFLVNEIRGVRNGTLSDEDLELFNKFILPALEKANYRALKAG